MSDGSAARLETLSVALRPAQQVTLRPRPQAPWSRKAWMRTPPGNTRSHQALRPGHCHPRARPLGGAAPREDVSVQGKEENQNSFLKVAPRERGLQHHSVPRMHLAVLQLRVRQPPWGAAVQLRVLATACLLHALEMHY